MVLWRTFFTVFSTVFLAEMGDKTQLATMLFAADKEVSKPLVFAAAAVALVLAAGLGVLVGAQIERFVSPKMLKVIAGVGFIAVGGWTLLSR
jgi:putative Ca2+/H+ antiporter (TMEM165/GDT1 family)